VRNFIAIGSWVSILWGVKIRHLPLTWPVAVNTVLALPRSLWYCQPLHTVSVVLKKWLDTWAPSLLCCQKIDAYSKLCILGSKARDGTSSGTMHSWQMTAGCSMHVLRPPGRHGRRALNIWWMVPPAWLCQQNAGGVGCLERLRNCIWEVVRLIRQLYKQRSGND